LNDDVPQAAITWFILWKIERAIISWLTDCIAETVSLRLHWSQHETKKPQSMSSFMLEPVAQSESKASLFKRLGLDEQNGGHRRLYTMMKVKRHIVLSM
jgi:hypothetical protein